MARFNEILVGRFNRGFQKGFGVKGAASVPVLSTEIQPQISVFRGAEDRYLEGWDIFSIGVIINALAGNTNGFRLRNPSGSAVIGVIEGFSLWDSATQEILVQRGIATTDLATISGAVAYDIRGRTSSSLIVSSTQPGPAIGGTIERVVVVANTLLVEQKEIPLTPGSHFEFDTTTANTSTRFNIWWRERFLEESERT